LLCGQRDHGIETGARVVENIRCRWPKIFYAAVKRATKSSDNGIIATEFAQEHDDQGRLLPTTTFAAYLTGLYFDPSKAIPRVVEETGSRILITAEDVVAALKKLSFNKAIGKDQLKDQMVRAAITESEEIATKVAAAFE